MLKVCDYDLIALFLLNIAYRLKGPSDGCGKDLQVCALCYLSPRLLTQLLNQAAAGLQREPPQLPPASCLANVPSQTSFRTMSACSSILYSTNSRRLFARGLRRTSLQ